MTQTDDLPPCLISIDKEGRWYHKGVEMVRREFIRLFYQHLSMDSLGRYVIDWSGERCTLEVEDTAYVVLRVMAGEKGLSGHNRFVLLLSDDSLENLDPGTLRVGKDHVLYCKVKGCTFPARFSRPAYYQLAEHVEEEEGIFYLTVNGQRHILHQEPCA